MEVVHILYWMAWRFAGLRLTVADTVVMNDSDQLQTSLIC